MLKVATVDKHSTPLSRMMLRSEREGSCTVWTGTRNFAGYGYIRINNKNHRVHRVMYEQLFGKVPQGMVIDHLCKNRACFNPTHLEVVTQAENISRAKKTHCKRGHLLEGDNVRLTASRGRQCRACGAEQARKWRAGRAR